MSLFSVFLFFIVNKSKKKKNVSLIRILIDKGTASNNKMKKQINRKE